MNEPDPISYESPSVRDDRRSYYRRWYALLAGQLLIAFFVLAGSVIICAVGGGFIGKAIAIWVPKYYPSVFGPASTQPGFDAVQVGIGTGAGQGAAAGVVVGLVLVLALAIANWRRLRPQV